MIPVNHARGETLLEIDGAPVRLCLTLGALAELEGAFGVRGFSALAARIAQPSATDLLVLIAALSGGGGAGLSVEQLARAQIAPQDAARAIGEAFSRALGDG
jgi:hypothetical protein